VQPELAAERDRYSVLHIGEVTVFELAWIEARSLDSFEEEKLSPQAQVDRAPPDLAGVKQGGDIELALLQGSFKVRSTEGTHGFSQQETTTLISIALPTRS
jgi:hypothetical protein